MTKSSDVVARTIPIPSAEGYRLWSRTYDTDPNPILALEFRTLERRLNGFTGGVFLDAGCGTGRWMASAAGRFARVAGVDLCAEMLQVGNRKPSLRGSLARADCHYLPFRSGIADVAICSFTIAYLPDPRRAIRELARVAKPGGSVIVTDLHPRACEGGWRRTFRDGDVVYELDARPIHCEALLEYGRDSGLKLREIAEPYLGEPERVLMLDAGRGDRFAEVSAMPAILCLEWERV